MKGPLRRGLYARSGVREEETGVISSRVGQKYLSIAGNVMRKLKNAVNPTISVNYEGTEDTTNYPWGNILVKDARLPNMRENHEGVIDRSIYSGPHIWTMIDIAVLEALTLANSVPKIQDDPGIIEKEENCFEKIKKIFMNALKIAVRRDPKLSITLKIPYFITFVGVCEILVYIFASRDISDILMYNPNKKCELWRFLTYILLHNDSIHLGLNIVIQCVLGIPLEYEQGHFRTGGVYIGGGLAGSLGTSVFENESMLIGASGCIYALLISQISHIILNYNSLKYVIYRSLAVSVLALADVAHICYHIYAFNNESPRIGLAAHFAGALSGFLCGSLFFHGTVKWKNYIHILAAAVVAFLVILVVITNFMSAIKCDTGS